MLMKSSVSSVMDTMPYYFVTFSTPNIPTSQHPNIKFTMKKEKNKAFAFFDACLTNKDHCSLFMAVYRKKAFSGLLTNFFSFTSYSYKIGLIRTLVDRAYKINTTLATFDDDVKKLLRIFKKNQ